MLDPSSEGLNSTRRRYFIGGSDARIIMGHDEAALVRLWREKRGEVEPEDLSGNLIVQLGVVTEELNRRWYEANTGQVIADIQRKVFHPGLRWMAATLDGRVTFESEGSRHRGGVRPTTTHQSLPTFDKGASLPVTRHHFRSRILL